MAYTAPQIGTILLKADRTMYKIGQIAYENMFAEDNEALDYERDIIFIYKKAVEYADDLFLGTEKLDKVVERLAAKISAYDYGELNPIYADAALLNISTIVAGAALNDLTDVTITNVQDNQLLRYNSVTGQWINVGPGSAVRNSQAFTATAGQTVFTTSFPFDAGLFDLYLNGVKLNSSSYTTFGEYQITLNDACLVGDIVDVVIFDPNTSILPSINSLDDLVDVSLGALVNNQVLYYNSATGLWQNGTVSGGAWGTITGTLSNQTDLQSALDAKVPYTGATTNVNLGEYEIKAGQVTLDTSPTGTAAVGTTRWNDTLGSSETTLKGGNVILKNGVDLVARVVNKVSPNTTLTKAAYQAVRVSGAQGQRLAVSLAQANNDNNSADTIGLVTETIATNQEGFIITVGQLENINTSGSLQGETWADGDVLYLSPTTAGALTNVKPNATIGHIVVIGYVEYAHANNGKIYVKVMNGWELGELHDVYVPTPSNNDVLTYETSSGLWKNKSVGTALGYTPANAATTLTINGVTYDLSANRSWTVSGGISGSGASGQVAYWTGTSAQSGSNNLTWDATNSRLGIGTNTPTNTLTVENNFNGSNYVRIRNTNAGTDSLAGFYITSNLGTGGDIYITSSVFNPAVETPNTLVVQTDGAISGGIKFRTNNANAPISFSSGSATEKMRLFQTGNLLLQNGGTFTDSGERLQVTGNVKVTGNTTFGTLGAGTGMYWDNTNNRLGIGNSSPAVALDVVGTSAGSIVGFKLRNTSINGYTEIQCFNNGGTINDRMYMGIGGTATGDAFQNRGYFFSGANIDGINFTANKSTGDIRFFTGGVNERIRFKSTGQLRFMPLASAPSSAESGDVYYNSTDNKHYGYNGTTWNAFY